MDTALGLVAFVVFILCVIAAAAAITWVVVKVSPTRKPPADVEPPAAG